MNLSGDDLRKAVEGIEESFEEATATIYGSEKEEKIDKENPFFGKIQLPEVETRLTEEGMEIEPG
jgi:hypothetical protein